MGLKDYRTYHGDAPPGGTTASVVNESTSLTKERNDSMASLGSVGTLKSLGSNGSQNTSPYNNIPSKKAIPVNRLQAYIVAMQKKKGFEKEYKALPAGMVLPHKVGLQEENRSKNRYINMIAYDHSRVVLQSELDADYINANYIDGFIRRNAYIATQGPTRNTTEEFWQMIWQEEVGKIVMLTNLVEANKVKCYKYWPSEDSDLLFNTLQITLNSEENYPSFVIRKISVIDVEMNETRSITQFHFTSWPDHGVPDPFQIMVFLRKVSQQTTTLGGPMVVHCSAGIGRTGTLIGIDSLYKQGESSYYLSINQYVKEMRQNRVNMVQTLSQYIFIHRTLLEMFACNKDPVVGRDMFYQVWADANFKDRVHDEYLSLMDLRPEFERDDYTIANDPVNIEKHRDIKMMAPDRYRAYLQSYSVNRTDYINAITLPSHYNQQGFILTQLPLKSTVIDLWQMLYDYQSNTVVIADVIHYDEKENGVFWPALGETMTLGAFVINCVDQSGNRNMTFNLSNKKTQEYSKKSIDIKVLIGTGWSENQDVPSDADYWFELHNDIHKWQEAQGQKPVTVICRDGGSRGALYCAVSNVLDGLDIYQDVDVFHAFRQIHNRKPEVLVYKEQYEHCYEVARLYLDAGSLYSS